MILAKLFGRAMLVVLGVALATSGNAQPSQQAPPAPTVEAGTRQGAEAGVEPTLEPKAIDLLKAMSARLASARTMTFTAISTYESPSYIGPPLAYTTISEVTLQRPDKLRVITPGDGPASEFYYDGKTMMAYAPAENLVAVAEAPPTIDGALKVAYDSAAIYFPFTDVIVADPYQDIADGLEQAFVIGQSRVVGGTTTDMVAIANGHVFAQVWIGADDKLPRMVRAVYANDPSRLRHQVEFSNWRLDGQIPADAFASSRAATAPRIPFARPDPKPPSVSGASPEGKPSETHK
jgi:hypothetical protein